MRYGKFRPIINGIWHNQPLPPFVGPSQICQIKDNYYKVCNFCHFFLKSNEVAARQCPIASGGALNDSVIFHGSSSMAKNSPVPSSSASNGQPFTVIAALPSTGMDFINVQYTPVKYRCHLSLKSLS